MLGFLEVLDSEACEFVSGVVLDASTPIAFYTVVSVGGHDIVYL